VESERLGQARASQQQLFKKQPAFSVRTFTESTPMAEELQARFARALVRAGVAET
jgi:adenylate cyclase